MTKTKKSSLKLLSFLLTLALVIGLMPGMSLTALAWDGDPYAALLNTTTVVHFDGKDWYLIEDNSTAANAGTVTLLAKECVDASEYDIEGSSSTYSGSTVETAVNNYYTNSISSNVKSAIVDSKMFLLTTDQANTMTEDTRKCSWVSGAEYNYWWLCSRGINDNYAAYVNGGTGRVNGGGSLVDNTCGVRPALKLDLPKVTFDSTSKTFTVGSTTPAAQQWTNNNVTATLNDTKLTVEKTAGAADGTMGDDGWTAVGSASAWRNIRGNITEIEIQDGVTSIGADAFYRCTSLTSITIPSGVTSIGNTAFSSCSKLTSVTIPGSVTSIGRSAFGSCTALTSISLPSGVTSIGANAFNGCSNLTSVTFPSGLTIIEDTVFANCSALTSVTFPSSLNSIGQRAFHKCTVLASVTFTPGQEGGGLTIGDSAFDDIPSTTKVAYGTGNTRLYNGETEITTTTALTAIQSKTLTWKASSATVAVTSVTLDKTTTSIEVGKTETLSATVEPNNATDKTVTWASSDPAVATVNENGLVTAVAAGTANITATSNADGNKAAECVVYVAPSVSISPEGAGTVAFVVESDVDLKLTATANSGYEFDYWSWSKEETEETSTSNPVTLGNYFDFPANTKDFTAHFKATTVAVTGVTLDKTTAEIEVGKTATLAATVTPANATDKTVTWTSSDTSVATVANGVVTAVGAGTATITAKAGDKSATCTVTVTASDIDISKGTVTVNTSAKTVTVTVDGNTVPASAYHIIYFTYEKIEGGETVNRVGTDFPTTAGTYIAAVVANENSGYTGENRSEPFTVSSGNSGGNSGGYTPVIPSGGTTTTTTTTNTGSFADKTEENNNYAGAEINMKTEDLEKAVLTDEDKKVIAAGGNVTVELEVEEMTPTAEEKKEVEAAVEAAKEASGEDYTVAMYFDANLFKTSNGTKTQLHETNGKIAVSFKLPAQFKNTDSSVTRTFAVARIHDGKTEILVCEYDPETDLLTFYTDKFSTYALMYEDAKADDADVSAVDDDDEQGDEGAVDDKQFDETDDDFDELTDDEGDFDDDFAEDQTDGDSDTDNDDQAAVDAVVDNGEANPNTGVSAGFGLLAVCAVTAGAALAVKKRKK